MRNHPIATSTLRRRFAGIALTIALGIAGSGLSARADETSSPAAPAAAAKSPPATTESTRSRPGDARHLLNLDGGGLALQGYDPVAYFVDGRATPGDPRWQSTWEGAVYRFASADHKRRFDAEPARYQPAFGGYCAYGASIDKLVAIDPEVFQIEDGRLLLQYDRQAYDRFNADPRTNLDRADANWPGLLSKYGTEGGPPSVTNRVRRLLGF